jgi:hypothetical protein
MSNLNETNNNSNRCHNTNKDNKCHDINKETNSRVEFDKEITTPQNHNKNEHLSHQDQNYKNNHNEHDCDSKGPKNHEAEGI